MCCDNGAFFAASVASRLGLSPDQFFELAPLPDAAGVAPPLPTPCTVEQALRFYTDLRAPAPKQLLLLLAAHTSDEREVRSAHRHPSRVPVEQAGSLQT